MWNSQGNQNALNVANEAKELQKETERRRQELEEQLRTAKAQEAAIAMELDTEKEELVKALNAAKEAAKEANIQLTTMKEANTQLTQEKKAGESRSQELAQELKNAFIAAKEGNTYLQKSLEENHNLRDELHELQKKTASKWDEKSQEALDKLLAEKRQWVAERFAYTNTIHGLYAQRVNTLETIAKLSEQQRQEKIRTLKADSEKFDKERLQQAQDQFKKQIEATVAKQFEDKEANLLQIINELKNHNGVRSPEENSHEESTSSRRSGGPGSAHGTDSSEEEWNISGEEHSGRSGGPGSAHGTDSSEEEWNISGEEHSGRSGGPGSAHGTDSAEDDPEEEYKVQKLEEANQKSGSRSWWDSEESEGSEEDSKRYIILHPDDEQLYINNVLRSATSFKETLIKNPVLENALETLKLSHSLTALQQHLQNVESLRDDLYHENGLQLNAANKIRKECWNFKLQCEKQLEKFEREQNNAQTQEAIKIVRAFIETWNVQDKNWDDSLTEQSLSDGDNVDSSSQAPDDKLRTLKLTLAKHKQARQDRKAAQSVNERRTGAAGPTQRSVNANPYLLPESLFFDTKYY
jgi:hypothetical protein